jgi:hypothetical protein
MAAPSFTDHAAAGVAEEAPLPLISSVDEYLKLRDFGDGSSSGSGYGETPRGAAVLFIHALINWCDKDNSIDKESGHGNEKDKEKGLDRHQLGEQLILLSMWEENVVKVGEGGTSVYKGYNLHRSDSDRLKHLDGHEYTGNSYCCGTERAQGYKIEDKAKIAVHFRLQEKAVGSIESGECC